MRWLHLPRKKSVETKIYACCRALSLHLTVFTIVRDVEMGEKLRSCPILTPSVVILLCASESKLDLCDVFKSLLDLGSLVPRHKSSECHLREDLARLGVQVFVQRAHRVVVLTQMEWRCKPDAAYGCLELFGQVDPHLAGVGVGISVIYT